MKKKRENKAKGTSKERREEKVKKLSIDLQMCVCCV